MKDQDAKMQKIYKEIDVEYRKGEKGSKKKIDSTLEDILFNLKIALEE